MSIELPDGQRVLAFFASDGRLFFVIPMGPKTCIGTTDTSVHDPGSGASVEDRQFVLDNINQLLDLPRPLTTDDIIGERCGVRPLAVRGGEDEADWVQLSRKHAIDVNVADRHLSIFGGKLTDCLNVGDEVSDIVRELGIEMPHPDKIWYGEPGDNMRDEFMHRANLMGLDAMTDVSSSESLSRRLWRRYGAEAMDSRGDPAQSIQRGVADRKRRIPALRDRSGGAT